MILDTVDYNQKIGTLLQDPPHIRMAKGPIETVERNTTLVRVLVFVSDSYTEGLHTTRSREYKTSKVIWTPQDSQGGSLSTLEPLPTSCPSIWQAGSALSWGALERQKLG
jgi:hypothetical protein